MSGSTTRAVKLGVWGAGQFANITAKSLKKSGKLEIVACLDSSAEQASAFGAQYDCAATTQEAAFLNTPGLEAVAIFTPNDLHPEHARTAARRGLHCFVEKPMANSVAECQGMIAEAEAAGITLMLGHNTRRENRFRRIKALLDAGELGQPVLGQISFTSSAGLNRQLGGWRYDPRRTAAVGLIQIGVHALDLAYYFFGLPSRISARLTAGGMGEGFLDACAAWLEYEQGPLVTFNNAYSVPRARSVEIMGTRLSVLSAVETGIKMQSPGAEPVKEESFALNDTLLEEYEEFAGVIRGEIPAPETGMLGGLRVVAMLEAMLRSSGEGRAVAMRELLGEAGA